MHVHQLAVGAEALAPGGQRVEGVGPVLGGEGVLVVGQQFVDLGLRGFAAGAALAANAAHQTLCQHAEQRVGEVERVHAHVEQACHGLWRAVGVQTWRAPGGQLEMTRRPSLAVFFVADFTHHDHVGVGAQEGAQRLGEGPVDLGVHLHLAQAGLGDFHRVFGSPDLALGHVDVAHGRVQRGGLARARGADAQEHAVGPLDHALEQRRGWWARGRCRPAAWAAPRPAGAARRLRHRRWWGWWPRAARAGCRLEFAEDDLAVLRLAALGDVEVAHDLDACDECAAVGVRQLEVGLEHAVTPESDAHLLAPGQCIRCGCQTRPASAPRGSSG